MSAAEPLKIAVVGAGPSGVSTAFCIQENVPDAIVTIIADKFSPNTTGDCAAGMIVPHLLGTTPVEDIKRWQRTTMTYGIDLFRTEEAAEAGVQIISGNWLWNQDTESETMADYHDVLLGFRSASVSELLQYEGVEFQEAFTFSSILIECVKYLPWLTKKFVNKGGKTLQRKVESLDELFEDYDLVVNCSGIGARGLGDDDVTPIRGQVMRVRAPWMKQFTVLNDGDFFILPVTDGTVVLGATHQWDNWNTEPNAEDRDRILQNCHRLVPSLKAAPVVSEWVGLRPYRHCVRLETEKRVVNGNQKMVVHNYGHGGAGVCLSWGCALDAAELVRKALDESLVNCNKE
ncbi:hypothetical protein CAPTEDRAFT_106442 [Capitella teleta]|uniref:FAD dependent oxidoreductase domain-containing protein n=1 Tax=Capitella teleta TaxID=283909 RepID=R7U392_CAPTE|nr:hypothetical protein CAPTEDRAFT_106442 [Capitella teleta]|eukprot:ELU00586.1 hypothetical protein CAPTEDRAFT_106442 [Capitella teleta]